jgi:aspartate/methionine/tyrosine aminotransferase
MSNISKRATSLLAAGIHDDYMLAEGERRDDRFHPEHNPDGYISLCVAENKLVVDLLEPKMRESRDIDMKVTGYDNHAGSERFRNQLAGFLGEHVFGRPIKADHLITAAGAGTILETLFYAIADAGEGVLVPTPSYAGFWFDLEARDALKIVTVHTRSEENFRLTTDLLDEALSNADRPVRALLFTTPNNPLGTVYSAEEVRELLDWCQAKGIHAVIDELYALSVFDAEVGSSPFVSAASFGDLGDLIHVVWAFSKDFAVSGLRAGVLYSQNEQVLGLAQTLAYWHVISGDTQFLLGEMISDREWVTSFINENQRRLGAAYQATSEALAAIGVSHAPSEAGFFLVADFRPFLEHQTWEAEHALWLRMLEQANVNITPGSSLRNGEPGFMRVCFASQPIDIALEGIRRVGEVLGS